MVHAPPMTNLSKKNMRHSATVIAFADELSMVTTIGSATHLLFTTREIDTYSHKIQGVVQSV
jgi:hypothetical protein